MTRFALLVIPVGLLGFVAISPCPSAEPKPAPEVKIDFNRDIRPILSNSCFACHGPDEAVRKGGLRLDTREGATEAGGIVPGKPEESEILKRILDEDPKHAMPPKKFGKKVAKQDIETLRTWIKQGAGYATHWSYVKPTRPPVPPVDGAKNPIDAFLLARLKESKLTYQPEADRYTLARRLALDLTGLPPTVAEVDEFVADKRPDAYEQYVDRMLEKKAFGEHWARLWLDLARYADSAGYADDPPRTIWAYRDYVINSFNANKPFDQFTIEQLAGDLLPNPTEEQLTATAFHRNTMTNNEGGTNDEEFRNAAIVDRVNTTMAVWMGTSMACAQCHTHKYDPISQKEYFRVFAFLNNTEDADRRDESPLLPLYTDEQKKQKSAWETELLAVKKRLAEADVSEGLVKWDATFPMTVKWANPTPLAVSAKSKQPAALQADGSIRFAKPGGKTDTYTVTLPNDGGKLSAIRLETLPLAILPGKGAGHGGGNFVVTGIRASIIPPGNKSPTGRYVRVELPGKQTYLMLAEVQVFSGTDNVATQGTAKQSSTDFGGNAKLANDGKTEGHFFRGKSVAHTALQDDPWWEVDLRSATDVDRIAIWARTDGGGERLANFRVSLLDDKRNVVWSQTVKETPKPSTTLPLSPAKPVPLVAAHADFTQANHNPADLLANPQPKLKGWAVGGAVEKPHHLTVLPKEPLELPAKAMLAVTIEQNSAFENHVLGSFRVSYSTDPAAAELARTPPEIVEILGRERTKRTPAQSKRLLEYYRTIAPETQADRDRLAGLEKSLANLKPATTVPIYRELPQNRRRVTKVQTRGNFLDTGDTVTEGVPSAFHPLPPDAPRNRITLAKWLVSPDNPLTARVTVNRFWEAIFGNGLVRTSEEFGSQGELPSHPELLDWLATEFVAQKWDTKAFLKLLVTSAAYRQSSRVTPEALELDPDNRLLSRGPRFRLPAETVRDQALAIAGLLSPKIGGPSVRPARPSMGLSAAFGGGLDWKTSDGEDRFRRGLYTEWRRTSPYPSMTTFDAPSREACTIRRVRTNTPLQALVTLNDPVYVEAAQALARKMAAAGSKPEEKLTAGFRRVLSRPPTEKETARLLALFDDAKSGFAKDPAKALSIATKPLGPLPKDADPTELAAWTVVSNVLLNLDETLMRR